MATPLGSSPVWRRRDNLSAPPSALLVVIKSEAWAAALPAPSVVSGTSGPESAEGQRLLLTRGPCGARERLWTPPGAGAIRAERDPGPVRWARGAGLLSC